MLHLISEGQKQLSKRSSAAHMLLHPAGRCNLPLTCQLRAAPSLFLTTLPQTFIKKTMAECSPVERYPEGLRERRAALMVSTLSTAITRSMPSSIGYPVRDTCRQIAETKKQVVNAASRKHLLSSYFVRSPGADCLRNTGETPDPTPRKQVASGAYKKLADKVILFEPVSLAQSCWGCSPGGRDRGRAPFAAGRQQPPPADASNATCGHDCYPH